MYLYDLCTSFCRFYSHPSWQVGVNGVPTKFNGLPTCHDHFLVGGAIFRLSHEPCQLAPQVRFLKIIILPDTFGANESPLIIIAISLASLGLASSPFGTIMLLVPDTRWSHLHLCRTLGSLEEAGRLKAGSIKADGAATAS